MRLVQMRFWPIVWWMQTVAHLEPSLVTVERSGGTEGRARLIDFVGQIQASHLRRCRATVFVHMGGFSSVGEVLLRHTSGRPVYTSDDCQHSSVSQATCAIMFVSLTSRMNCSRNLLSSDARVIYSIDVGDRTPLVDTFVEGVLTAQRQKWLFNTIFVVHNASTFGGYYFDPIRNRLAQLGAPNGSIYPRVGELKNLRGYSLHTAYIPHEADPSVIAGMLETLVNDRNGTLPEPMGLQAVPMLEFSRKIHWQFSLLTVGPLAYATCFFVPRAGPIPIGYILVRPFDTGVWVGVLMTTVVVVLLLKRFGQASRGSVASALITLLQSVLTSPNRIARSAFERRVLSACSLGCVVLVSSYQSMIFSLISNPAFYPELDTEQQINRSCSLYVLGMHELGGIDTFRDSFVDRGSFRAGKSCVCTTCWLEPELQRFPHLTRVYRASRHRTHPFPMLISLVDRHYQPLNALVERYVSGFFEAGLTVKLMEGPPPGGAGGERRDHSGHRGPNQQLRMSDLHIVWIVLEIGLALAVVCFLLELALKHWRSRPCKPLRAIANRCRRKGTKI